MTFLALVSSMHRLRYNDDKTAKTSVRSTLWETALRLEEGDVPAAERDLRAAQKALEEALAENAPQETIARLVEELREAMRRFMEALARQGPTQEMAPPNPNAPDNTLSSDELEEMLDQIERMSEAGARDQARELLSQLQQMLESLNAPQQSPMQQQMAQQMNQMMNQLNELQQRQQELIDQTFQRNQQNQPQPDGPPNANAGRQPDCRNPSPSLRPLGPLDRQRQQQ